VNGSGAGIAEATRFVTDGDERKALQLLHELVDSDADPELRHEIHDLAATAHESSHGFEKIEWHRLMLETEK